MNDDLAEKIEELLKSLLSLKQPMKQDFFVPTLKPPTIPKPSMTPSVGKIPGGLPPPSKKDPRKMAEQLKNPRPGKVNMEVLKIEENGQWSLSKGDFTNHLNSGLTNTHVPSTKISPPKPIADTKAIAKPSVPPSASVKSDSTVGASPERRARNAVRDAILNAPIHAENEGFKNHHSPEQNKLIHGLEIHNAQPMRGGEVRAGGAQLATNPTTKQNVILKAASDHANQQERGHLKNGFNSAKREVLFHNMARDYFGMGKHVPTTAGFTRRGEDFSVQQKIEGANHLDHLPKGKNEDGSVNPVHEWKHEGHADTLKKLHSSGDLHKLALMDNIMGHHDRHGGNVMADKDNLHLIDNGTAFDYGNFDQHHYPKYMAISGNKNYKGMGLDNTTVHPEAVKWLNSLDPQKAKDLMAAHGHDENSPATQGFLRRLQGMKNAVNNGQEHYKNMDNLLDENRYTTGPLRQFLSEGNEENE